jgi:uncharacterized iron-regulated protein
MIRIAFGTALACLALGCAAPTAGPGAPAAAGEAARSAAPAGRSADAAPMEGVDFRVYTRDGGTASMERIAGSLDAADVLLVGEEHDDMVGHALETRMLADALARYQSGAAPARRPVVLSLEMFERDVQYILDEYLRGLINEEHFLDSSRPWDDYRRRYRPLIELAKKRGLPVVAANAPRRYVNRVTREGPGALEALGERARSFLPPLPYPGPSDEYRRQWNDLMAEAMGAQEGDTTAGHGYRVNPNAIWAQALWDAAMGEAVASALDGTAGALVIHLAGSFHVERGTGIPERISDYRPGTRVVSVVMTKVEDVADWSAEKHAALADFVILTRASASGG